MAPKTRKDMRAEAAKKRRKQLEDLKSRNRKNQQDLKIKKLTGNLYNKDKRGKITTKKKGLANIPVQERSAPVNKKARGLSSLGSDYKKQEEKLSKIATKKSAKINKARYPKMGTYKGKDGKSVADEKKKEKRTPSGKGVRDKFIRYKGKMIRRGTPMAKKAEKIEEGRKKLAAKGYMRR